MGEIADANINGNLSHGLPFAGHIYKRPVAIAEQLRTAEWFEVRVTGRSARPIGTILKVTLSPDERILFVKKKRQLLHPSLTAMDGACGRHHRLRLTSLSSSRATLLRL